MTNLIGLCSNAATATEWCLVLTNAARKSGDDRNEKDLFGRRKKPLTVLKCNSNGINQYVHVIKGTHTGTVIIIIIIIIITTVITSLWRRM